MSELPHAVEADACDADAAQPRPATPGVLSSLAFWICLLLAAGAYGLATLAPTYVQNRQLAGEYAATEARLHNLVAQNDRYERYCGRLAAAKGSGPAPEERGLQVNPSPRPSPQQHVGSSRGAEHGGEGEASSRIDEAGVPSQQMVLGESLQFHLDGFDGRDAAVSQPAVAPLITLVSRSAFVLGGLRTLSALLLLLAFTLCLESPGGRSAPNAPRRFNGPWQLRHPLEWLRTRYGARQSPETVQSRLPAREQRAVSERGRTLKTSSRANGRASVRTANR